MSKFFNTTYDVESSDDETLFYSDDEQYLKQLENKNQQKLFISSTIDSDEDDSGDETLSDSESENNDKKTKAAFSKSSENDDESDQNGDNEDEDEDESSEWDSDSDEEESSDDDTAPKGRSYFLKNDFLKGSGAGSDSGDEDEKKVVKSAKDKYLDEIASFADNIENLSMVQEWVTIATEFEKLNRLAMKHTQYHILIPRFYIKAISVLEDSISDYDNSDLDQKLNASESKSLNILRQKIKKEVKLYSDEVELYKKDPETYEAGSHDNLIRVGESDDEDKEIAITKENLIQLVKQVIETRGKKGVNLNDHLKTLNQLLAISDSTYEKILLLNLIISLRFELYSKAQFIPTDEWNKSLDDLFSLLEILNNDQDYIITENAPANEDISTPPPANKDGKHLIVGSITAFVERLYDEFISHLLYTDPNSSEYISLLKDDSKLYSLIINSQVYLNRIILKSNYNTLEGDQLSRIILKRIESIYYKPVKLIVLSELDAWKNKEDNESISKINSSEPSDDLNIIQCNKLIDDLCSHIYNYSAGLLSPVYRKKAALMQSYYYSTSNQFFRARDILHLTHVQTTIHTSEPGVQVLFNRAISQLGLAAFRAGLPEETQTILNEIVTSTHTRELLGQGRIFFSKMNNNNNNSADSSNEKGKYVPFHMQINIELLDAVYYISSLFVEVPLMALQSYQGSTPGAIAIANAEAAQLQNQNIRKNTSRSFKRILEYTERQYFQGPAEETRDSVFEAYNQLIKFNWKSASKILSDLRVWGMMPSISLTNKDNKTVLDLLNEMLIDLCKVQSLKVWTFVNSGIVSSYSIRKLSRRFELEESKVCNILTGLIFREEIKASLKMNESDDLTSIIFEKREDGMNEIIRGLTDRVNSILERNEKLSLGGYQIVMKKK